MHNYWLKKYNIDGEYSRIAISPDKLDRFLDEIADLGFYGGNVTLPHKEIAFARCDSVTDLAHKTGAVNTIWLENGRLIGDNTDVVGFLTNLDAEAPGWERNCESAAIIGAGGAARAVLAGLASRDIPEVTIVNRSPDRLGNLAEIAELWGFRKVTARSLEQAQAGFQEEALLVNTTALGMTGQPKLPINLAGLALDAVVCDIVYAPLDTDLLTEARRRGHRVATGLGMLLHQAVPGFEKWFGVKPEVSRELRALIEDDIRRPRK